MTKKNKKKIKKTDRRKIAKTKVRIEKKETKKKLTDEERDLKVKAILRDLRDKITELEEIKKDLEDIKYSSMTPQQARKMLEEIKIPNIKPIKETNKGEGKEQSDNQLKNNENKKESE